MKIGIAALANARYAKEGMSDFRSTNAGDNHPNSASELLRLVYGELRRLAAQKLSHEAPGQTLQATALVHEAWLKLKGSDGHWENRAHFFGAAAEAMRRILIDRARKRRAEKRGGGQERADFEALNVAALPPDDKLLAVHELLDRLAAIDSVIAEIVKFRLLIGLTIPQCAAVLEISEATVGRKWAYASAWLELELKKK